jgi:hypothetical protein
MQGTLLQLAQAKPKINPADRPMLDHQLKVEGYGHVRGKACLMLNRTSVGG